MPTLRLVASREFWRDEVKPDGLPRVFGDAILFYHKLITIYMLLYISDFNLLYLRPRSFYFKKRKFVR